MIFLAAVLAMAQVVVPSGQGLSADQRVALLAREASGTTNYIQETIYRDPAMRAEIRRVGFVRGCGAVQSATREVVARHEGPLRAAFAATIRAVIPEQRLMEGRFISFLAMPYGAYSSRVRTRLEQSSGPLLTVVANDMRRTFLARTQPLPTTTNPADNVIAPRQDIGTALGVGRQWNLDNPLELGMACIEQHISPANRPTITTGAPQ